MSRVSMDRKPLPRQPIVEIIDLIPNESIKFMLSNTDLSIANSLRRVIISEIPCMAIDIVEIYYNTSVLNDEFLAHRLGLIPLISTNINSYNYTQNCDCIDGCNKCSVVYHCNVQNTSDDIKLVTARDLIPVDSTDIVPIYNDNTNKSQSFRDIVELVDQDIIICKLGKNQELSFKCIARKGIGKEHSKWSTVAVCSMSQQPEIKLNQSNLNKLLTPQQRSSIVESCPTKVYGLSGQHNEIIIEELNNCVYCEECTKLCTQYMSQSNTIQSSSNVDLITIHQRQDQFIFTVETTGCHKPEQIVLMALDVLQQKLQMIKNEVLSTVANPATAALGLGYNTI